MTTIDPKDMRPEPAPGKIVKIAFNPADYRANYIFAPFKTTGKGTKGAKKRKAASLHGARLAYGVRDPWSNRGVSRGA